MKFSIAFVCFSFLIGFQSYADSFEKEMSCYNALISKSNGANFNLENKTILIPGIHDNSHGFYIYAERESYFCYFPKKPSKMNTDYNYYYFELKIPNKKPLYISYSDNKSRLSPGLATSDFPNEMLKGKYIVPKCVSYSTNESRAVFESELKTRIALVKSTYDNNALNAKFDKGSEIYREDEYIDALKTCLNASGEVKELAKIEIEKFLSSASLKNTDDRSNRQR